MEFAVKISWLPDGQWFGGNICYHCPLSDKEELIALTGLLAVQRDQSGWISRVFREQNQEHLVVNWMSELKGMKITRTISSFVPYVSAQIRVSFTKITPEEGWGESTERFQAWSYL